MHDRFMDEKETTPKKEVIYSNNQLYVIPSSSFLLNGIATKVQANQIKDDGREILLHKTT